MNPDPPRTHHPADHSALFDLDALMADDPTHGSRPLRALAPQPAIACPPPRRNWIALLTVTASVLAGGLALATVGGVAWRMATTPTSQPTPIAARSPTEAPKPPGEPMAAVQIPPAIAETAPTPADPAPAVAEPAPEPPVHAERTRRPERPRRVATITRTADPSDRPAPRRAPTAAVSPAPTAPASMAPKAALPKTTPATGSSALDEVDEMLRDIDRAGHERMPQPPAVVDASLALPERLSRRQILHAVRRVGLRIGRCPGEGTYRAELKISPAGRVEQARVTGDDAAARTCVERAAREMRFPRFSGAPMTVALPFKI